MEEFVAVRSMLDYEIGSFTSKWAAWTESLTPPSISERAAKDELLADLMYSRLLSSLKREALLFDKIYILDDKIYGNPSTEFITELEWLSDKNLITLASRKNILDNFNSRPAVEIGKSIGGLIDAIDKKGHRKKES